MVSGGKAKRAILSVSNKTGLAEFAQGLAALGYEIISTGGTAKQLSQAGLAVRKVSEVTASPEILGGRVKTLHPKISGGILARLHLDADQAELKEHGIGAIAVVCVNLYPFAEKIAKGPVALEEAIEEIDIGGPTMIRAAAKNFRHVLVIVDPNDYPRILEALQKDKITLADRFELAKKAFHHTALYDATISEYFSAFDHFDAAAVGREKLTFPQNLHLHFKKNMELRYGENPHQKAAFYLDANRSDPGWVKHHGKELSFNNLLDMEAAVSLVNDFTKKACVIVKHNNPCGVALDDGSLSAAYDRALACDTTSAFGGIVAFNAPVDAGLAEKLAEHFYEVIAAPAFHEKALAHLKTKKNLRLIEIRNWGKMPSDIRRLSQGVLVQDPDDIAFDIRQCKVVTHRQPTPQQWLDMDFAWKVAKAVKSNAIVLARDQRTIGIGAGQMSRVDSCKLSVMKNATGNAQGAVLASDAFFPFRDGVDFAAEAGVGAMIQPGGSVRDDEVIAAANEKEIAMVFTAVRHFRH